MAKWKKTKRKEKSSNPIVENFLKLHSEEEMELLQTYDVEKLKLVVAEMNAHVLKAKSEMEANKEFQAAKAILEDFRSAFADTRKYSDARKLYCLLLLQGKGIVDMGEAKEEE